MLTLTLQDVLISVLLIALIVLVVFLIVLVSKATDSIKKANSMLDGGMNVVDTVKGKVDGISSGIVAKKAKIGEVATTGLSVAKTVIDKVKK